MKILRQGIHPKDRWYKGTCYTCLTEIEFQQLEGKLSDAGYMNIECPTCGEMIVTDASVYQTHPYSEPATTWRDI